MKSTTEAKKGRSELLNRKMGHMKRFDSADYYKDRTSSSSSHDLDQSKGDDSSTVSSESDMPQPPEIQTSPVAKTKIPVLDIESPSGSASKASPVMVQRFLQKKSNMKRWDSGDHNAISADGLYSPIKADLDIMSISSTDRSEGYGSPIANDIARSHRPPAHLETSPVSGSHVAAQKRIIKSRVKRFDSADYFRGLSPPSSQCDNSPISPRQSPGHTHLIANLSLDSVEQDPGHFDKEEKSPLG